MQAITHVLFSKGTCFHNDSLHRVFLDRNALLADSGRYKLTLEDWDASITMAGAPSIYFSLLIL